MRRYILVCPAANVRAVNSALERAGYGPNSFTHRSRNGDYYADGLVDDTVLAAIKTQSVVEYDEGTVKQRRDTGKGLVRVLTARGDEKVTSDGQQPVRR